MRLSSSKTKVYKTKIIIYLLLKPKDKLTKLNTYNINYNLCLIRRKLSLYDISIFFILILMNMALVLVSVLLELF